MNCIWKFSTNLMLFQKTYFGEHYIIKEKERNTETFQFEGYTYEKQDLKSQIPQDFLCKLKISLCNNKASPFLWLKILTVGTWIAQDGGKKAIAAKKWDTRMQETEDFSPSGCSQWLTLKVVESQNRHYHI